MLHEDPPVVIRFSPVSEFPLEIVWSCPKVLAVESRGMVAPLVPRGVVAAVVNGTPLVFRQVIMPFEAIVQSPYRVSGK